MNEALAIDLTSALKYLSWLGPLDAGSGGWDGSVRI